MENSGHIRTRITIAAVTLAVAVVLLISRYVDVMVLRPDAVESRPASVYGIERGPILDRNGRILALQTELYTISAWLPHVRNPDEVARELAQILDTQTQPILNQLTGSRNYVYIQRRVSQRVSDRVEQAQAEGRLPGITLEPDPSRTYPHGDLASHVLGFVGTDNRGLDGIEYSLDALLSPTDGRPRAGTLYGNQVVLTIDLNIQQTADRLVREALARENADSAMMVVMAAQTGEILAYSSAPTFNPNTFARAPAENRRNRPISMIYEPGSVFKVFSLSAAMELGVARDGDMFNTDGVYRPDNWGSAQPITDITNYGTLSLRRVVERSSNIGVAYATEGMSSQDLFTRLKAFGFGEPTGIEINGEEPGIVTPPERWTNRSKPTIAMGQEIGVTALQIATAATAFANDGVLLAPRIISEIISPEGETIDRFERTPVRDVISPYVANTMLDYMRTAALPGGTGVRANVDGINIAAKTGTAEFFDPSIRAYSTEKFIGSTLALFPSENPEIIVYTVVENPQGEHIWGARVAAPVVQQMAEFLIPYLGIRRDGDSTMPFAQNISIEQPPVPRMNDVMPDLRDMPLRSLTALYTHERIDVEIHGSGWVVRQSPAPGTRLQDGMTVRLELE